MTSLIGPKLSIGFLPDNKRDLIFWSDGTVGNWVMNTHKAGLGALAILAAVLTPFPISWGFVAFAAIIINESLTRHPGGDLGKITTAAHSFLNSLFAS